MTRPTFVVTASWSLVALAFCLPTDLDIAWDGLPFDHRRELAFLLFALLFFANSLARRLIGGSRVPMFRPSTRHACAIGILALLLLTVKGFYPASSGIARCWWAPRVADDLRLADDRCLLAAQPYVKAIHFGPQGEPWKPGLLNTTTRNLLECPRDDLECEREKSWRARHALPFRVSFELRPSALAAAGGLDVRYAGRVALELRRDGADLERIVLPYASVALDRRIDLAREGVQGARLIYWNYACLDRPPDASRCSSSSRTETLSLSDAVLSVGLDEGRWRGGFRRTAQLLTLGLVAFIALAVARAFWKKIDDLVRRGDWPATRRRVPVIAIEIALLGIVMTLSFAARWSAVTPLVLLAGLSTVLLVLLGHLALRGGDEPGPGWTADLLFSLPVFCLWIWTVRTLPSTDGFALQSAGDDWLTFTSVGYFMASSPHWFADPNYVFSKPLYIYFRAVFYPLLGEGTAYLGFLLRFALGCTPFLLVPLALTGVRSRRGAARFAALALFAYCFFWVIASFSSYLLVFPESMSEIPAWLFAIVAGITLLYSVEAIDRVHARLVLAAAVLSCLSLVMRPQTIAALIPLWALATLSRTGGPRRRTAGAAAVALVSAGLIVVVHALPSLLTQRAALHWYLGVTTELRSPEPLSVLLSRSWPLVIYEPHVGVLVVAGCLFGTVFVWLKSRSLTSPILFALGYLAALALHLVIKDQAYHPRHYVLFAQVAAYLSLYCGIRVISEPKVAVPSALRSSSSGGRRLTSRDSHRISHW